MKNDHRQQNCPLCGSSRIRHLGLIPISLDARFSTHSITLEKRPELWTCVSCSSWFSQHILPESDAISLYSSGSSGERWSKEKFEKAKCPEVLAELGKHFREGTRVLDIGCNTGELLDYAKNRGCATAGVEYSEACKSILESKGHVCFKSLSAASTERFDVITAFDLIEHLYNVRQFLTDCQRMLLPGGRLVLLTGDNGSLSARLCRKNWWYLQYPEHIVFPSMRFLASSEVGFSSCSRVRTYASLGYCVSPRQVACGIASALFRGGYVGLPSIGPDHMLVTLGRD